MAKLYAKEEEKLRAERVENSESRPTMRAVCLGPAGSFSELAAQELCKGYALTLCESFASAAELLLAGEADYAVLPVENSLNGGVLTVLDLIARAEMFGEEEYLCIVDHRLATLEGVREEEITAVCSHEQALGQCAEYLRAHFPRAALVSVPSTSESLARLDAHTAGIVGAHMRAEGVVLSPSNIADNKQNFTRFLRFARGNGGGAKESAMVFFCAVCPHKPGALLGLLRIFQRYGLNLTRIESRPVKEAFGEYRFFVEFAGNIADGRVQTALHEAERYCSQFKLLGAYH